MTNFRQWAWGLVGLALIGTAIWVVFSAARSALLWLGQIQSELATAIVAAGAAVLVSVLSVAVGKYLERRDAFERETRLKKVPVYESLISFIFGVLHSGKPGVPKMAEAEMVTRYGALTENLIVWSSDSVLKQFGEFRVASLKISEVGSPIAVLATLEDLMLAIRRDLGYRNTKIARGDLLRLFINDLDQHREALALLKR
ncbi:MAG: hypothetical protein WC829_20660 [Hyphomicrobium sp.]